MVIKTFEEAQSESQTSCVFSALDHIPEFILHNMYVLSDFLKEEFEFNKPLIPMEI